MLNEVEAIVDALIQASRAVIREDQRRAELHRLWDASRSRCGNCFFWMKSSLCPKEHNVNGYARGPSCNGMACEKFERTETAEVALEEWEKLRSADPSEVPGGDD